MTYASYKHLKKNTLSKKVKVIAYFFAGGA